LSLVLAMIERELSSFVSLLDSPEHLVREAVGELIGKIDDLGMLQLREAASLFVKMLNDCNYKSHCTANSHLKRLAEKRVQLVAASLQANSIVAEAYEYQRGIFGKQ